MDLKKIILPLLDDFNIVMATQYISPKFIFRATRKTHKHQRKDSNVEIYLTIGKPNYREREFIKLCIKAKESFPLKKVQLKFRKHTK